MLLGEGCCWVRGAAAHSEPAGQEEQCGRAPADRKHRRCTLKRNSNLSLPVASSIQLGICKYLGPGWLCHNFCYF